MTPRHPVQLRAQQRSGNDSAAVLAPVRRSASGDDDSVQELVLDLSSTNAEVHGVGRGVAFSLISMAMNPPSSRSAMGRPRNRLGGRVSA
jgi:hypothetical protein